LQANGVAVKPPPIIAMQLKTPKPKFMQAMIILFDNHCLLQKIFTTQMPKYNVSTNCQPDFYNEKPRHTRGRLEPLVIFFLDKNILQCHNEETMPLFTLVNRNPARPKAPIFDNLYFWQ
jgi:hypothetical protein